FRNRDGSPDMSFGIHPVDPELGRMPGVTFRVPEEDDTMRKAPKRGVYTLDGMRYVINEGDELPDGAAMDDERAQGPAPENRKLDDAPQNRSDNDEKPEKGKKKSG